MRSLFSIPRWAAATSAVALPVVLIAGIWLGDGLSHGGEVARNVHIAGDTVGGLGPEDLDVRIQSIAARFDQTPIIIESSDGDIELDAGRLGVHVDVERTAQAAMDAAGIRNPVSWMGSLFTPTGSDLVLGFDPAVARSGLSELDLVRTEPTEGRLDGSTGELKLVPGAPGQQLDVEAVVEAIPAAVVAGESPIRVQARWTTKQPKYGEAAFAPLVAEANTIINSGAVLKVNEYVTTLPPELAVTWFSSEFNDQGEPELVFDRELAVADIELLMAEGGVSGSSDPLFLVDEGEVSIGATEDARICCEADALDVLIDALEDSDRDPAAAVELPVRVATPDEAIAAAEELGIIELVSDETTKHNCCESRVTNIQLFADIVRGTIIEPGETISLNEIVGKRTREKGFVGGGFIQNGVIVTDVGGGVSQFATTIFNAAFFAGLDFPEYQAHSIYISRYPYGREATISWPKPDLKINNPTPYAVLVWPSYTDTSITVQMFSTKNVEVEQTAQSTSWNGVCRNVVTERTRVWDDGNTEVDIVKARYRPEGQNCDGSPSDPNATTTTIEEETTTTSEGDGGSTSTSEGADTTTTTVTDSTTTTVTDSTTTTEATTSTTGSTTTTAATTTTSDDG
ncbi:MAG: hypothetical protein GY708_14930 [Actinomycetia bacterium]|nr:hypothetical protein [Actinomycetes bacterium]MCP4960543.1 hypothetical protein [Actinomycetes bacterium]